MKSHNRSQVKWGIALIGLGILFLLNNMGVISYFNWRLLLHFWPVIIIVIGLNIILRNTPLWWLTPLILVFGIIVLFFVSSGPGFYNHNYNFDFSMPLVNRDFKTYRSETEINSDIVLMEVELNFSAGKLVLDSLRDGEKLYKANLSYRDSKPQIDYLYEKDNNIAYLSIKQAEKSTNRFTLPGGNNWELNLLRNIPLKIKINAAAGDFNLKLEELKVQQLTVNSAAGDLEIDLGKYTEYLVLNSAAANVDLNIPDNRALSIKTEGLITNNNFVDKGLIKIEKNLYQTRNYQESNNKLIVEINSPASNIDLDFYRVD